MNKKPNLNVTVESKTAATLTSSVMVVKQGTKGETKNKYNVVKVNRVYSVEGDDNNFYYSLYANQQKQQQSTPTINNNRMTTNNTTSTSTNTRRNSNSVSQQSGNRSSSHQEQQQHHNNFNLRFLNERQEQQQHYLYPLQHYPYNPDQEQQALQQNLNAFAFNQPIIAADNGNADNDDYDPRPQYQQAQQHQQHYANNQRYGIISLSNGLNIGSWCTRSWG